MTDKKKNSKDMQNNVKQKQERMRKIGTTMMFMFIGVIVFSLLTVGFWSLLTANDVMKDTLKTSAAELLVQAEASTDIYLDQFVFIGDFLSKDPNVLTVSKSKESEPWLMQTLANVMDNQESVQAVYYATEAGKFYLQPQVDLPPDFDARTRPWYQAVKEAGTMVWTDPYSSADGSGMVVTLAKPVVNNGKFEGVVGVDVSLATISDLMNNIKIGEKGYPVVLDGNLTTMTHKNPDVIGKALPIDTVVAAMNAEPEGSIDYVWEENGEDVRKFAVFSTIETTGWRLMATMYEDEVQDEVGVIFRQIILVGFVTLLVAIVVSVIYSRKIGAHVNDLLETIERIKTGDLTARFEMKAKNELGMLGRYFGETTDNLASLIRSVKGVVGDVTNAAENLAATSEETSASADEVARTVEDIARGAQDQAGDAEKGALIAKTLSERFQNLKDNTDTMLSSAQSVMEANLNGSKTAEVLKEKSERSDEAQTRINQAITQLNDRTQHIGGILDTISSISEQTNLLALNASIEAARAGEHGRGFAVVAEEIRKLAEESASATDEIRDIVVNIQSDSERSTSIMGEVKGITEEQNVAVNDVYESFNVVSSAIDQITSQIERIGDNVVQLESDKDEIVSAIENISAVSEETAAASEEVTASMDQQTLAVEEVARAAEKLNELAGILNNQIGQFKV